MFVRNMEHQIKVIFLLLVTGIMSETVTHDPDTDKLNGGESHQEANESSPSKEDSDGSEIPPANSYNTILLNRPTALQELREETKSFTFVNKKLVIKQKWEELGVAGAVWDSGVVLAEYLEKNKEHYPLSGKSVIELGAGTGLVSMVAALLGAKVVATDRKIVLKFLQENIQANFPCTKDVHTETCVQDGQTSYIDAHSQGVQTATSDQDEQTANLDAHSTAIIDLQDENSQGVHTATCDQDEHSRGVPTEHCDQDEQTFNLGVMELDWGQNHKDFDTGYDYVIGADIVYLESVFQQLLDTLVHLSNSKNMVILSCRIRFDRDVRFLSMMEKYFKMEEVHYDDERDIKIYFAQLIE